MLHFFKSRKDRSAVENKTENIERLARSVKEGAESVSAFPAVLYLEATSTCNLHCPMCPTTMDIPEYRYNASKIDMDLIDKLDEVLPLARRCFLSGGGEPLLHPRLFEIISRVKAAGSEVIFNCNATLLYEEKARWLVDAQVDCISFSIDGSTSATYEAIRSPARFDSVIANIARLSKIKKSRGNDKPYLNLQYTVLDKNMGEISGIVPLAERLGINQVVIEPLTPVFCFNGKYEDFYKEHAVSAAQIEDELLKAQALAKDRGMLLTSHYLENAKPLDKKRSCIQPWTTFGVRVDGRVFTCCGTPKLMGNLAESSFEEIWNGKEYRSLRRSIVKNEFPDFCKWCLSEDRCNHFNADLLPGG